MMTTATQNSRADMQRPVSSRRQIAVKKLILASPVILLLALVSHALLISAGRSISHKVVMYVRVARLSAQEPDRKLSMPVQGVAKKQVANTWHADRGDRRHEGQDIFAPRGTAVLSATDGYILKMGENNLGGQTVSVIGAGGWVYYYAHLDSYAQDIAEGDYVNRETVLGYVGTTGNASGTPPHLHFGVYAAGGAMNPLPLLSDRPDRQGEERLAGTSQRKKPQTKQQRNRMVVTGT